MRILLLVLVAVAMVTTRAAEVAVVTTPTAEGGYRVVAPAYTVTFDAAGNLRGLTVGGTAMLASVGDAQAGAGFISRGTLVPARTLTPTGPDTFVAEGASRTLPPDAKAGEHAVQTRAAYHFFPDRFTVTTEQHLEDYGYFGWFPSPAVAASFDAQTDCPVRMTEPLRYQQTDPRWTTDSGAMLRFDFGVWQKGFANANWGQVKDGTTLRRYVANITPGWQPITMTVYPLAHPTPADALTYTITAADPDFNMPGGAPVHFAITTTNAGPDPLAATVRFEVRDYLTRKALGGRTTRVKLAAGTSRLLPTEVRVRAPGIYRAAIIVLDGKKAVRTVEWIFTYDYAHYAPATTRPADFTAFWQTALAESAALPLDVKMTPAPEKSTATLEAFKLSFATLGGRRIYGWYARPKAPGTYPARLKVPSSGIYPLGRPDLVEGTCTLWISITGFDVDLSNMPAGDDPGKRYWTAGIERPETSMWRTIYVSLVRAMDVLAAQPQVNRDKLIVYGGSQGGGLAMVAAALDPRIKLCLPMYSGLARLDWTVQHEPGYWPFTMTAKPAGQTEATFLRTLSYFDAANFTPDIRCPVLAEVGLMDTVTASGNQLAALAHVPATRRYVVCAPWGGHGTGTREGNRIWEYYDRFLKGQEPIIAR